MRKWRGGILMAIAFFACHSSNQQVLGIDSMKVVMYDMMRMDQYFIAMQAKDSTVKKRKENIRLYDEVLALHHLTKAQFDSSYRYYERHPSHFKELVDSLDMYAVREKTKIPLNHGQAVK